MNETPSRLVQGFLIGIGVVIAISIFMSLIWLYWMLPTGNDWEEDSEYWKAYSDESKLLISSSRRVVRNDELVILGTLDNQGKDSWEDVFVEVEVFDHNGIFLDECSSIIESTVAPSSIENFKLVCASCKDIEPSSIASHTIRITSASYHWLDDENSGP